MLNASMQPFIVYSGAVLALLTKPLAFWRAYRGLSLASLAGAADVPQTELVRLEAGATDGDVRVFARLAAALRVRIDDLVIA